MTKNVKTNTRNGAGSQAWIEGYNDLFSMQEYRIPEIYVNRLAQELVMWASTDTRAYKIGQFIKMKKIAHSTFYHLCKHYPVLKAANDEARCLLGVNREVGALEKKLDAGIVSLTMPMYDPEWKENAEWKAKLSDAAAISSGMKLVYMPAFPDSPVVPVKKIDQQ